METYKKLLLANKAWAKERTDRNPTFFQELAKDQKPEFLWIGCADSRVPAEEVTGAEPGELFVHRNIANLALAADLNFHGVMQYAVDALEVKNIIVCGHYGCGGVRAALSQKNYGTLNKWLYYIKEKSEFYRTELDALNPEARFDRMVELNVIEQVKTISRSSMIQAAWKKRGGPNIHGWVFGLNDGLIRPLTMMNSDSKLEPVYQFET